VALRRSFSTVMPFHRNKFCKSYADSAMASRNREQRISLL
jgi:hypothetical protein